MRQALLALGAFLASCITLVSGDASDTDEGFPLPPRGSAEEAELRARTSNISSPVAIVLTFVVVSLIVAAGFLYYANSKLPPAPSRKRLGAKKQRKINAKQSDMYQESE